MQIWGIICPLIILQLVTPGCMEKGHLPRKCKLPPKKGYCRKFLENVYYDPKRRICRKFIYGGCGGNKNNFASVQDCLYECKKFDFQVPLENVVGNINWEKVTSIKCRLKPQKGWCRYKITRYYYDSKTSQCRVFTYSGCGGNENNFSSYDYCAKECDLFVIMPRICKLPPKQGKCKEEYENFYYDYKNSMCKTFIFGGCGGNKNNFASLLECYYKCKRFDFIIPWENVLGDLPWRKAIPWKCKLWAKKGWCKAKIPRYYFNAFSKRCRLFTYGGCGGNANNFLTFDDCSKECDIYGGSQTPLHAEIMQETCNQPLDVGPCIESFRRFYYDRTTKTCKSFNFGGCIGNRNNFFTHEDCVRKCIQV